MAFILRRNIFIFGLGFSASSLLNGFVYGVLYKEYIKLIKFKSHR